MKTRRDFLKAAAAVPILSALPNSTTFSEATSSGEGEPVPSMIYAGKPMSYWLAQLNSPDNEPEYEDVESDWVFLDFGVPALRHLVEALRTNHGHLAAVQLQYMASSLTVRLLTEVLGDRDWRIRAGAMQALLRIAVRRPSEPQVTESLKEALPVIARAKWDENPDVAELADNLVYEFGPAIEPRCPLPVRYLEDEDASRRALAVRWLRGFRSRVEEVIPLLESKLEDPEESVRWAAAETLSSFEPNHPAIPPIFVEGVLRTMTLT